MVEKNTAMGREMGMKVREMLPTSPRTKIQEISLVTNNSVKRKSSKVNKKQMKKKVLTIKGRTNCAARYLWSNNLIGRRYLKFPFPARKGIMIKSYKRSFHAN
jgi:hypothetical protein